MAKFIRNPRLRQQLQKGVFEPALAETIAEFETVLRQAIEDAVYFWDRPTTRATGQTVSSPRDIVDTGAFRDSQIATQITAMRWEIAWTVAYAAFILVGGIRRSDGTVTPGRDWIGEGLDNIDLAKNFATACRRRFGESNRKSKFNFNLFLHLFGGEK